VSSASSTFIAGVRPGGVLVQSVPPTHRYRDDEGDRGQAVDGRQDAGMADQLRKVMDSVAQQGAVATYKKAS
jgi:hypothetical protein